MFQLVYFWQDENKSWRTAVGIEVVEREKLQWSEKKRMQEKAADWDLEPLIRKSSLGAMMYAG